MAGIGIGLAAILGVVKQNFNINEYFNEIERLNTLYYPSIEILSGIEFSEPHLFKDEFEYYSSLPFDYILRVF